MCFIKHGEQKAPYHLIELELDYFWSVTGFSVHTVGRKYNYRLVFCHVHLYVCVRARECASECVCVCL